MVAYTYPNNVNEDGELLPECEGKYCRVLPQPVFPTSFYETIMCTILFLFLWTIRKRISTPGIVFSIYLILTGIERFFIELIRVNAVYNVFGFHPTQAEVISILLILTGIIMIIYLKNKKTNSVFIKDL
jgi:prolipoprotein diacylglyceryltransferase